MLLLERLVNVDPLLVCVLVQTTEFAGLSYLRDVRWLVLFKNSLDERVFLHESIPLRGFSVVDAHYLFDCLVSQSLQKLQVVMLMAFDALHVVILPVDILQVFESHTFHCHTHVHDFLQIETVF